MFVQLAKRSPPGASGGLSFLQFALAALFCFFSPESHAQLKTEDLLELAKPISQQIRTPSHNVVWCGPDTLVSAVVVGESARGQRTNLKYTDLRTSRTWTRNLEGARTVLACSATGARIVSVEPVSLRTSNVVFDDLDANSQVTLAAGVAVLGVDSSGRSLVVAAKDAETIELGDLQYFDLEGPSGDKPLKLSALLPSLSERSVVANAAVNHNRVALLFWQPTRSDARIVSNAELKLAMVDTRSGASRIIATPAVSARWYAPAPVVVEVSEAHAVLSGWLPHESAFEFIRCSFNVETRPSGNVCGPVTSVFFDVHAPPMPPLISERLVLALGSGGCDYLVASRREATWEYSDTACLTTQTPTYVGVEPGIEAVLSPDRKKLAIIAIRMGDHDANTARRRFVEDNTWLVFSVSDFIRSLSQR